MRVLLTGGKGQLAQEIAAAWSAHEVLPFARDALDIASAEAVDAVVARVKPDCIVNTAAFHFVDACEDRIDEALRINVGGAANLARAAQRVGAWLVQFSTDYVFDGEKRAPYVETDIARPLSTYGMTRLAGEWAAQHYCARTYVIRTCGLYGVGGATTRAGNFVETMLRLARAGKPIRVVDDQVLTPTSTVDVARALLQLVPAAPFGIYHLTNTGQCSWYEFARELFRLFDLSPDLSPTTSAEFNSLAMRPPYSVLDNARLRSACIADLRDWHEALADYARQVSGVSSEESGR